MKFINKLFKTKKQMEKQEALKRLDAIEKESKKLRAIIEAPEKPLWTELWRQFCEENDKDQSLPFANPRTKKQEYINAHAMLAEIVEVANKKDNAGKEWTPDWNDNNYKYTPYFDTRSGSGFAFYSTNYWGSGTDAGSRLCFLKRDTAEKIAKKYLPIYEKFMMK